MFVSRVPGRVSSGVSVTRRGVTPDALEDHSGIYRYA
jgi:hypothetical protein